MATNAEPVIPLRPASGLRDKVTPPPPTTGDTSTREELSLLQLPLDIKLAILGDLDLHSFRALTTSCRTFYDIYNEGVCKPELVRALTNGMPPEAHTLHRALSIRRAKEKWDEEEDRKNHFTFFRGKRTGPFPPRLEPFDADAYRQSYDLKARFKSDTYLAELIDMQITTRYFARLFQGIEGTRERRRAQAGKTVPPESIAAAATINANSAVEDIEKVFYDVWLAAVGTRPLSAVDYRSIFSGDWSPRSEYRCSEEHLALFPYVYNAFAGRTPAEYRVRFANMHVVAAFIDNVMNTLVMAVLPDERLIAGARRWTALTDWFPICRRRSLDYTFCERYGGVREPPLPPAAPVSVKSGMRPPGVTAAITPAAFAVADGGCDNFVSRNDLMALNGYKGMRSYLDSSAFCMVDRIVRSVRGFRVHVYRAERLGDAVRVGKRWEGERREYREMDVFIMDTIFDAEDWGAVLNLKGCPASS
ncbi:hypothetical protein TWF696_001823 [Orbilia brochopaga]|uniref:F-box domain-containing protein n=1 Tax=Orbilia brochopaga TaxID=3140254 RepID=A0AAV9U5V7_9PEZI